jgi:pimeloyl-ACP methyl ester carboxylesterase
MRGQQPRAVFLHGFASDLHTWDGIWDALGEGLPALRYDLRGFGQSVSQDKGAFAHADDLLAILDASDIEQCDLIGVSMGGSIAVNFALDHSDRIRSLLLISPGLIGWEWSDAWLRLWRPIVDHARSGALKEARRLWWEHPLFSTTRSSAAALELYESIMRFPGAQWVGDHHRRMLPDVERLHRLTCRTLLLTGGHDFADFRLIADLIEASAGDIERSDESALGHLVHLEDPPGCARKIRSFLALPPSEQAGCEYL